MIDFERLTNVLPPFIARNDIQKYFGNIISPRTLANMDAKGIGPEGKFQLMGKVIYTRENLVNFIKNQYLKENHITQ